MFFITPIGCDTGPRREPVERKDAILAKMHPHKMTYFAFKMAKIVVRTCTRTRVCALNVSLSHPEGV